MASSGSGAKLDSYMGVYHQLDGVFVRGQPVYQLQVNEHVPNGYGRWLFYGPDNRWCLSGNRLSTYYGDCGGIKNGAKTVTIPERGWQYWKIDRWVYDPQMTGD